MKRSYASMTFALSLAVFSAQACLYPKPVGSDRDAGHDAGDSGVCVGSDGVFHSPGDTFLSPDGCNTCSCSSTGYIACTARACVALDANNDDASSSVDGSTPRTCRQQSDCTPGEACIGPPGCGVPWTCRAATRCTADLTPYCSCRGVTVHGSSWCPPEPYVHAGECTNADAGASDAGASDCVRTGCSGEICADRDMITTCQFRPEYSCYATARCERQGDGSCGWTLSASLRACISARGT